VDRFSGFVGREKELTEILEAFGGGTRGILIVGTVGSGKTSLLNVLIDLQRDRFPGGVFMTRAFWKENPQQLLEQAVEVPLKDASLFVIDDAQSLDESAIQILPNILQKYPQLSIVLASQRYLALPGEFQTITLSGLNLQEFQELIRLRNAVGHGEIDDQLLNRLFRVTGGNALAANVAVAAVHEGAVASWPDLFEYLRNFYTPGLVGADGRPLTPETAEYKHVVVGVTQANSVILEMLKKQPELAWKLPSRKFEEIVAEILDKQGYEVTLTPASGDGGFDIYAARKEGLGKFLYLVECKRYAPTNKVGVEIVRSLYGVIQAQRATAGAIVTTSFFTSGAKEFQREVQYHLHLHDYLVLQNWIADFPFSKENVL
jgi:restriction system protein